MDTLAVLLLIIGLAVVGGALDAAWLLIRQTRLTLALAPSRPRRRRAPLP